MTELEWLRERHANCVQIAAQKSGDDKAGWLEDAGYFEAAIKRVASMETALTEVKLITRAILMYKSKNHWIGALGKWLERNSQPNDILRETVAEDVQHSVKGPSTTQEK